MTLWLRMIALCTCLVTAGSLAWAEDPDLGDRYLKRYRGPYRGQVIDADTKAPLAGAVVVVLWRRHRVYPFQVVSENYAVREVVTDSEGRFFLEAKSIEEGGGSRVHFPEFLIFKPAYGAFPRRHRAPKGFLAGIFEGTGTTVELPRIESREERRRQLLGIGPHSLTETPFKDLPQLMRSLNEESVAIGVSPYSPTESR
jgi:hypothetical protein